MLRRLTVCDFSLLRALTLEFEPGLSVITGESGAGKTLIFDAIGFALGGRSQRGLLAAGALECQVELDVELSSTEAKKLGAPWQAGLNQIRRRYSAKGRNRVEINSVKAAVGELASAGALLFEITGQFESSTLYQPETHLSLLDAFGDSKLAKAHQTYATAYKAWFKASQQLSELTRDAATRAQEVDFLGFQVDELKKAGVAVGERDEVEGQLKLAENAQAIVAAAADASRGLSGSDEDSGAYDLAAQATERVEELSELLGDVETDVLDPAELSQRLNRLLEELREVGGVLRDVAESIRHDPHEAMRLAERFDLILKLERKYAVSGDELSALLAEKQARLELLTDVSQDPEQLSAEVGRLREGLAAAGSELSKCRLRAAGKLEKTALKYFDQLEFAQVELKIEIEPLSQPAAGGLDQVEFLISLNPGEPARPLAQVASGGEASRLLLGLKAALAEKQRCAVMLLDEIESGLGGQAAEKVALVLAQLAENRQVLAITHLPQVAARGIVHLAVSKEIEAGRTAVGVARLSATEREDELARMLGSVAGKEERALARRLLGK